jgi:hypothetical protein
MKRPLQLLAKFVFSLFATSLSAAAIGNPSSPSVLERGLKIPDTSWWNLRFGFCEEVIIEQKYYAPERQQISGASVKGQTQAISATWNIRERLDLQAILGWGELRWQWQQAGVTEEGSAVHGFYWNAAAKLILFQIKNSVLSTDMRGGGWHDFGGSFQVGQTNSQSTTLSSLFWQAAVAFSQKLGPLCPYAGIALQQDSLSIHSIHLTNRFRKGPFGGFTFSNGSYLFITAEGCGWYETACSISCEIRL